MQRAANLRPAPVHRRQRGVRATAAHRHTVSM
jgi:hypothetical protein